MARKILLADDSVTAQNMGRKILADAGYEVITVNNGSAALKKIADTKPDIIILDVYMPGYSGLEVCQRLKEAQETSRIPVLLTVGKLEPFKPEEAKRVRAEGYIVKPFEASELLSALSKLEDKIVPRAEPSKPGRFARANAALDEGKHDKAVQSEEDSGWKNRIGFPSKNKKAPEEESDDSSIYNAVNKDLRTVVDRKPAHEPQEAKSEDSRFDLGALAPEGLPKDVTPEEIAALAAAAAQVKGKLSESEFAESAPAQPPVVEAKAAEAKIEEKPEAKDEARPAAELPKESLKETFEAPAATFAAQKAEEPVEAPAEKPVEFKEEGAAMPSPAEMMAAIAGLVPEAAKPTSADSSSGNGSGSHATSHDTSHATSHDTPSHTVAPHVEEPVTMAAAAGAGFGGTVSRWTAVATALAPDEAAISLEHEMQKAYAAFAAAEVAHTEFVAPVPQTQPAAVEPAAAAQVSAPVEAPVSVAVVPAPAIAPETTQAEATRAELAQAEVARSISAVAGAATEALSGAVKEFERVAASYVEPQPPVVIPAPQAPEPTLVQAAEPVAEPVTDIPRAVETKSEARFEESPVVQSVPSQLEAVKAEITNVAPAQSEQKYPEQKYEAQQFAEPKYEQPKHEDPKRDEPRLEEPFAVATAAIEEKSEVIAEKPEPVVPSPVNEAPANEASANTYRSFANEAATDPVPVTQISSEIAPPAAPDQPAARVTKDIPKGESEIAETTAAAWASWRRIRESGDTKAAPSQAAAPKAEAAPEPVPAPLQEEAAMAVAAGAEKSPEEIPATSEDSPDIANMVDSVLAGLRPQIVEEISRKLGKKK